MDGRATDIQKMAFLGDAKEEELKRSMKSEMSPVQLFSELIFLFSIMP